MYPETWTSSFIGDSIRNLEEASRTLKEVKHRLQSATYALAQEIEQDTEGINHELGLIEIIEQQRGTYKACVIELDALLRQMMHELAETPVEDESGLVREISTKLLAAEVEARIANELNQQRKYQAHMRTTEGISIITTLPPTGGISQRDLLTLIDKIKQRNLQAGYLRLRSDVEREIASRQQQPPDEPPPPPTRPHPPSSPPPPPAPMKRRKKVV